MFEPQSLGTVLEGRYRIIKTLGKGGMGVVYQATDEHLRCLVAVKEVISKEKNPSRAFEREARLLAHLRHAALPKAMDYFQFGDSRFFVMEYIDGDDLEQLLHKRDSRPFAVETVLGWADDILDALEELHSHKPPIIHRDIKPNNLKLSPSKKIVLLDFGLAKGATDEMTQVVDGRYTIAKGYVPGYSSLEQMTGEETTVCSDLYSLAATLWTLLTGDIPPDAVKRVSAERNREDDPLRPANQINTTVSTAIADVLHQAMSINARQRPPSASEMRRMLREAVERPKQIETQRLQREREEQIRLEAETKTRELVTSKLKSAETLIQDEREKHKTEIADLQTKFAQAETQILTWRDKAQSVETELDALKTKTLEVEENYKSLVTNRDEDSDKIKQLESERDVLQTRITELERERDEFQRKLSQIEVEQVEARTKTSEVEVENARLQKLVETKPSETIVAETRRGSVKVDGLTNVKTLVADDTWGKDSASNGNGNIKPEKPTKTNSFLSGAILGGLIVAVLGGIVAAILYGFSGTSATNANRQTASNANNKGTNVNSNSSQNNSNVANKDVAAVIETPMIAIAGGEFTMGRDNAKDVSERPAHKISVESFSIDAYETTNEDYLKFVKATNRKRLPSEWRNGTFPNGQAKFPVVGVNWSDANDYAKWVGKRLPTEEEWEFAARGGETVNLYPWGDEWKQGFANANGANKTFTSVGTYKPSASGIYDMIGNAWEWTASDFKAYPNGKLPADVSGTNLKVIRGGSFESDVKSESSTATYRIGWSATNAATYNQTGFRCAKDAN